MPFGMGRTDAGNARIGRAFTQRPGYRACATAVAHSQSDAFNSEPDVKCKFERHLCVSMMDLLAFGFRDQCPHAGNVVFQVLLERREFVKLGICLRELGL